MESNKDALDLLYKLKKEIEKSPNEQLMKQINEMIKKVYNAQYTISFVGHFSAGKSTLINNVIGQNILPSSPVPTTSNTVQLVSSTTDNITVNLNDNQYTIVDNQEDVKKMNTEDRQVESIEIAFKSQSFSEGFTFQDTPGVDSTTSNHKNSAFQYLLTSNFVFYTVDYNHVQSDMNFNFIKSLNKMDIPVVLLINQVDKHDENEISFETYKSRVNQSIEDWKLDVQKIFYVSKFETENNEMHDFKSFIQQLDEKRPAQEAFIEKVSTYIKNEQLQYINSHMEDILQSIDSTKEDFEKDYEKSKAQSTVKNEQSLIQDKDKFKEHLKVKRKDILDNAYLMPYEIRERIRVYLETTAKNFKVKGFFNKEQKKADLQQEALLEVKKALDLKIHDTITKVWIKSLKNLNKYITDPELFETIINQKYTISEEELKGHVKEQTSITNDYVLIYSNGITDIINRKVRQSTNDLIEKIVQSSEVKKTEEDHSEQLNDYERYKEYETLKQSLVTNNYQHYYIHLDESIDKLIDRTYVSIDDIEIDTAEQVEILPESEHVQKIYDFEHIKDKIKHLTALPIFKQEVNNLEKQVARLDENITKIAVFGTFSAGKSTLINAILKQPILVSSPNPTTASITEISYGHTQEVSFKSYDQLLEEINHITEITNNKYDSIEAFIADSKIHEHETLSSNHIAFFKAIKKNFDHYKPHLMDAETLEFSIDEIEKLTAEDEHAAFVHKINLRLDEPWLKDKILIDSPGLNSNNQRHTRETEQIIASSDLIIYVSYYNHAFTDKDAEFLSYMRDMNNLKQSQGLKFVINAIDLAESEEDQKAVLDYVKSSLRKLNIKPDCYPVSSKKAIHSYDDQFKQFKESLDYFVQVESKNVLQTQIDGRIQRLTSELQDMIQTYKEDKHQLDRRKNTITELKQKDNFKYENVTKTHHQFDKEMDEQIYYLKNRLNIQLNDVVKKHFNTSTVTDNFKQSLHVSTKRYTDEVNQKLSLESSLIAERLRNFYENAFEDLLTPTIVELNEASIFISKFNHQFENEISPTPIQLNIDALANETIKSISKKDLLKTSKAQHIQSNILNDTIALISTPIKHFHVDLNTNLTKYDQEAKEYIQSYNQETTELIDAYLSMDIDNERIEQIESILKKI